MCSVLGRFIGHRFFFSSFRFSDDERVQCMSWPSQPCAHHKSYVKYAVKRISAAITQINRMKKDSIRTPILWLLKRICFLGAPFFPDTPLPAKKKKLIELGIIWLISLTVATSTQTHKYLPNHSHLVQLRNFFIANPFAGKLCRSLERRNANSVTFRCRFLHLP